MLKHLLTAPLLLIPLGGAQAEDRNNVIMKTIYTKIENILGVSDESAPVQHAGLVLAAPGFILDTNTDFSTVAGRGIIFSVADRAIQPNWVLRFGKFSTSELYNHILNDKDPAPATLSDADKVKLQKAKLILYKNGEKGVISDIYKTYRDLQAAYYTAQDTYVSQVNTSSTHTPTSAQSLALQQAYSDYFNYPHYSDIVGSIDDERSLSIRDPSVFWGQLRNLYDRNLVPSGTGAGNMIAPYGFYPSYKSWLDSSLQWTTIALTDSDESHTQTSSHTSWGAGLGAGWGLWRVNANYGQSDGSTLQGFDASHYSISFDVLRVLIFRPWMDASVYGARNWRWSRTTTLKDLISSGDVMNTTPSGQEPFIAQELILARNVKITGDWTSNLKTTYSSTRSGGGGISYGPFSFGGSGSSTYDESKDHNQVTTNGITSPSVQIIGMLVDILPKTPDPDPQLFNVPTFPSFVGGSGMFSESVRDHDAKYQTQYKELIK